MFVHWRSQKPGTITMTDKCLQDTQKCEIITHALYSLDLL